MAGVAGGRHRRKRRMRIKKRTRPADFGAAPRATFAEATPEAEAVPGERPSADPQAWSPAEAPRFHSMTAASSLTPAAHEVAQADYEDAAPDPFRPPPAWPLYLVALAVSALWALGPIAFAFGYRHAIAPLRDDSFAMLVFGLLAIGPGVFVFFSAYMVRQGQKLGAESRRTKAMAEEMLAPAIFAAARAGQVTQGVRDEI